MKSIQRSLFILKLFFLFCGMFILGAQLGKLHAALRDCTPASASSESASWGLSFQTEGERPVGNASIEELRPYNAYYVEDTDAKKIYLTFDCGYENGNTPLILDALKKHQAPAVFFVVGNFISDNPDLIKRIVSEGQKQLDDVEELYKSVTDEKMTKFYRPPQGIYSTSNLKMAKDLGYSTFFWSLAYVDWIQNQQPSKDEAFQKLLSRVHPGAIVLLHNTSATNGQILDELLTKWEDMGYQFHSLKELSDT